jgi:cold shock CspA family protein
MNGSCNSSPLAPAWQQRYRFNGSIVETRKNKSLSKDRRFPCFVFIHFVAIEENRISLRYDTNRINISNSSLTNSGYTSLRTNQNVSNSLDADSKCKVLFADNSVNWSLICTASSLAAATFSLNGFSTVPIFF